MQTFLALRMLQDQEYKAYVPVDTTLDTSYTEAQDNEIEAEYMSESLHVKMPSSHVTRPLRQRPWAPQILGTYLYNEMKSASDSVRTKRFSFLPSSSSSTHICRDMHDNNAIEL